MSYYRVMSSSSDSTKPAKSVTTSSNSAPSSIKSKADADQAVRSLDAEQVDKTVDPSQLDQDLSQL
jgi:hypothetical protein